MEILRVENLSKTYGSGNAEVRALDNISFSVKKGE
ncbi:MAG TPA: peptide ABC transporter ATP-binding protein, partial [Clostridiaceae bacterium]|nr:peptide ABC transporter ATP-binding protein [Clostridiaceae bacterium]